MSLPWLSNCNSQAKRRVRLANAFISRGSCLIVREGLGVRVIVKMCWTGWAGNLVTLRQIVRIQINQFVHAISVGLRKRTQFRSSEGVPNDDGAVDAGSVKDCEVIGHPRLNIVAVLRYA